MTTTANNADRNATRYATRYADAATRTVLGRVGGLLLCEHATMGGDGVVVVVDPVRGLAALSPFYEVCDMMETHGEYRPHFGADGVLRIGNDVA